MRTTRAFLIGYLDKRTGKLLGATVLSEETPTSHLQHFTFCILKGYGEDYQSAQRDLARSLDSEAYAWAKSFIDNKGSSRK